MFLRQTRKQLSDRKRKLINSALSKLYSYACYNDDFLALWCAIDRILDNK